MKTLYFINKNFVLEPCLYYGYVYKNHALFLRESNGIEICYTSNGLNQCYVARNQSVYILNQENLDNITPEIVRALYRYKDKCHKDLRNLVEKYTMFM